LAGLDIRPLEVLEEVSEIQESELKYVCISPIVLVADGMPEEELRQFIPPTSPIFADLLYESTMRRMVNLGIDVGFFSARENFSFRPDLEYLRKSKDNDRKFSRVYTFDDRANVLDLRGYTFPFYLKADSEVHEFLFNSGFGEATENGFGMVDFADRKNRTQLLEFRQIPGNIQEGA
jgi:CRISPR-associated endoribonuclease Cas6